MKNYQQTMKIPFTGLLIAAMLLNSLASTELQAQAKRGGGGGGGARPKASAPSRPAANNKPNAGARNTPAKSNSGLGDRNNDRGGDRGGDRNNVSNSGNRTNNIGSNNNKVNIDNSKRNVNVNVDNSKNVHVNNSRNTSVRRTANYRPYPRPPYMYGGYRYRCYRPYFYHPFHPFVWGPVWHPWGFFIATLATTAIIVSFADNDLPPNPGAPIYAVDNTYYAYDMAGMQSGPYIAPDEFATVAPADEYWYDEGVFYLKGDGGYTVVSAPVGAIVKKIPTGFETITLEDKTVNYYYGGAFYEKNAKGYKVVPPTAGAVVEHLSEGGEEVKMGDVTYVKFGDTYYQPVQEGGKNMYEVADVEADK